MKMPLAAGVFVVTLLAMMKDKFIHEPIRYACMLDTADAVEIFERAFDKQAPEHYRAHRASPTRWQMCDAHGREVLVVENRIGQIDRNAGVQAFMVLATALKQFPEALCAGFSDGTNLHVDELDADDLLCRYSGVARDSMRRMAIKASMTSAFPIEELMRSSPQKHLNNSVDNFAMASDGHQMGGA